MTEEEEEAHRVLYKHEAEQKEFEITRDPDGSFCYQGIQLKSCLR